MKYLRITPSYVIDWVKDTSYCHHGIPLSNGVFGALIWFRGRKLMITVNRADYWDHRGGMIWTEACNFGNLRSLLEAGAYAEAQALFQIEQINGQEKKPTRLPMGRFEVNLKEGVEIVSARLDLMRAEALVVCSVSDREFTFKASILIDRPVLALSVDPGWVESITCRPAYEFPEVKTYYDQFDIQPHRIVQEECYTGWTQELPADPACCALACHGSTHIAITGVFGDTAKLVLAAAREQLLVSTKHPYEQSTSRTREAWKQIWEKTADISLPDKEMERMYMLGIYKMLGNSMPGRIAPTLQGPWVEEHRMPPWCGDYHFNINVQECLWPAYAANHLECLLPLFEMIDRWKPLMAKRAKAFADEDDGYQMVHACDDRGQTIGRFWTGIIDHANTSWIAQMMWQYGQYAQDREFLVGDVYPFMKKALHVFLKMTDDREGVYSLPVSVSPEYGGAGSEAWGKNSSFFLANVHFLCDKMLRMIEQYAIDREFAARLKDIQQKLPLYTTGPAPGGEEIYLWEGRRLAESHRHHSHLAAIYPFDIVDVDDELHAKIIRNTYRTWVQKGMGNWTGWSMPWASILHGRMGGKDMAYLCLKLLREVFTMPGFATSHNAQYAGFTTFAGGDVMQVEASIALSAAVLDMLVQCVQGEIRLFPALPDKFADASFAGIRAEGAFLLSAERRKGIIESIHIYSTKGGPLRLRNPISGTVRISGRMAEMETDASLIRLETTAGDTITIRPARNEETPQMPNE